MAKFINVQKRTDGVELLVNVLGQRRQEDIQAQQIQLQHKGIQQQQQESHLAHMRGMAGLAMQGQDLAERSRNNEQNFQVKAQALDVSKEALTVQKRDQAIQLVRMQGQSDVALNEAEAKEMTRRGNLEGSIQMADSEYALRQVDAVNSIAEINTLGIGSIGEPDWNWHDGHSLKQFNGIAKSLRHKESMVTPGEYATSYKDFFQTGLANAKAAGETDPVGQVRAAHNFATQSNTVAMLKKIEDNNNGELSDEIINAINIWYSDPSQSDAQFQKLSSAFYEDGSGTMKFHRDSKLDGGANMAPFLRSANTMSTSPQWSAFAAQSRDHARLKKSLKDGIRLSEESIGGARARHLIMKSLTDGMLAGGVPGMANAMPNMTQVEEARDSAKGGQGTGQGAGGAQVAGGTQVNKPYVPLELGGFDQNNKTGNPPQTTEPTVNMAESNNLLPEQDPPQIGKLSTQHKRDLRTIIDVGGLPGVDKNGPYMELADHYSTLGDSDEKVEKKKVYVTIDDFKSKSYDLSQASGGPIQTDWVDNPAWEEFNQLAEGRMNGLEAMKRSDDEAQFQQERGLQNPNTEGRSNAGNAEPNPLNLAASDAAQFDAGIGSQAAGDALSMDFTGTVGEDFDVLTQMSQMIISGEVKTFGGDPYGTSNKKAVNKDGTPRYNTNKTTGKQTRAYDLVRFDPNKTTMGDILKAHADGEMFAAGGYQMIPDTFKAAMKRQGFKESDLMNERNQKILFTDLIINKRPKIWNYIKGTSDDLDAAATDLALEWRSIANSTGVSESQEAGDTASITHTQAKEAIMNARHLMAVKTFKKGGKASIIKGLANELQSNSVSVLEQLGGLGRGNR